GISVSGGRGPRSSRTCAPAPARTIVGRVARTRRTRSSRVWARVHSTSGSSAVPPKSSMQGLHSTPGATWAPQRGLRPRVRSRRLLAGLDADAALDPARSPDVAGRAALDVGLGAALAVRLEATLVLLLRGL